VNELLQKNSIYQIRAIHQRRPVEKGEGVCANVDDLRRGMGEGWPSGRSETFFLAVLESDPPLVRIEIYSTFWTFLRAMRSTRPRWGGGVGQTHNVRQGAGGLKSQFVLGRL